MKSHSNNASGHIHSDRRAPRGGGRSLRGQTGGEEDDVQAAAADGGGGEGRVPAQVHAVRRVSGTVTDCAQLQTYFTSLIIYRQWKIIQVRPVFCCCTADVWPH